MVSPHVCLKKEFICDDVNSKDHLKEMRLK